MTAAAPPLPTIRSSASPRRWTAILSTLGPIMGLALVYTFFAIRAPQSFSSQANIVTISRQTAIVGIAALGMTLIIISGGIDLSVGSLVALVTVTVAYTLKRGYSPITAAFVGILTGLACGAFNGTLISLLRVVPFIITLGTLLIFRGSAKGIANEQKIDTDDLTWLNDLLSVPPTICAKFFGWIGDWTQRLTGWRLQFPAEFPYGVWIGLILAILVAGLLRYTRLGRHIYAIGSNELTARLCGVPINRVKISVYAIAGMLTGVAGIMQFSRLSVGDPTVATGLELDVIAAVVIGGGSLTGGEGSVLGTIIGALMMTTIHSGGSQMGWPNWRQEIITGGIIILTVTLDRLRHRHSA